MRFTPFGKAQGFTWTTRKMAAAVGRGVRTLKRNQALYPLLADQMPAPEVLDVNIEAQRRDTSMREAEQRLRDFHASVWRAARRDAQGCTTAQRDAIRAAWATWTGPVTSIYFRYIVDLHTGVMERRALAMREKTNTVRINLNRAHQAQQSLELFA